MILYHGSSQKNLKLLEPKDLTKRAGQTKSLVYTTPNKAYASCFLFVWDDSWVHLSFKNGVHTMDIFDKQRFYETDHGGAIYVLDTDKAFRVDEIGLEFAIEDSIVPVSEEIYSSAFVAMSDHGVVINLK